MRFKFYDVLSHLIPGFIVYLVYLEITEQKFDKDFAIPATAIAFVIGYFVNTISSWLEGFYYWTWNGKPSNRLLDGKDIPKVRFYSHQIAIDRLLKETSSENPSNDELFNIAMRYATSEPNSRVEDFNSNYAFSRIILTTSLIASIALIYSFFDQIEFYIISITVISVSWLRCKQRGYYFAREVLRTYLKIKASDEVVQG